MEDSWYSEEGTEISKENLLTLHKTFTDEMFFYLNLHYKYRYYYSIFISALYFAFVTGLLQYHMEPISKILLLIPLIIITLSEVARRSVHRCYLKYLESIVKIGKIENLLGLHGTINIKDEKPPSRLVWEFDKQFVNQKYMKERYKHKTSEKFVNDLLSKGENKYARTLFLLVEVTSFGIFVSMIIYYILPII